MSENKTNLSTILNTMFNPITSNTIKGFPIFSNDGSGSEYNRMLTHGAAIAGTYGTLAYLIRLLGRRASRGKDEAYRKKIADAIEAQEAVITPDPDVDDIEKERAYRSLGVPHYSDTMEKLSQFKEAGMIGESLRYLIPVIAMLGGGYAGYKMADKGVDIRENKKLDDEIERLENEYEQARYYDLLKTRGVQKPNNDMNKEAILGIGETIENIKRKFTDIPKTALALATLIMGGTAIGSGYVGYNVQKKLSEKNKKREELLKELERSARSQHSPTITPILTPELQKLLNARPVSKKPKIKSIDMDENKILTSLG